MNVPYHGVPWVDATRRIGVKAFGCGDFQESLHRFKLLANFHPDNAAYRYDLACVYNALNQLDDAIVFLEKALEIDSADDRFQRDLSKLIERRAASDVVCATPSVEMS